MDKVSNSTIYRSIKSQFSSVKSILVFIRQSSQFFLDDVIVLFKQN